MTRAAAAKLEVVPGVLTGFKVARLVTGPNGYAFEGLGMGGTYGPHDLAVCVHREHHVPPVRHCGCGFYALKSRERAAALINHVGVALLDVELWGRFEEFEHGYIAAVQHVRRVTLAPFCLLCLYTGAHELRDAQALVEGAWRGTELVPACAEHLDGWQRVVTPGQLAEAFGVDVVWADEDDAITQFAGSIVASFHQPRIRELRGIEDLLPGETAFVFANAVAAADDGSLWLDPLARLVQPLAGTDVPIRLGADGVIEVGGAALTDFDGWGPRDDPHRYALPAREVTRAPVTHNARE